MSHRYTSSCPLGCKVYVGGLTQHASREELEGIFERYGRLRNVFVARNPPGFAFIEYENPDDAEDSVRALDGRNVCGVRARVEISHGKSKPKDFSRGGGFRDRNNDRGNDRRMDNHRDSGYGRERPFNTRDRDYGREKIRRRSRSVEKRRNSYNSRSSSSSDKRGGVRDRKANERSDYRSERRRPVNIPSKSRSRS